MLPELLFSVGSSMQDISREDFSLLNGGCDKDNLQLITGNDCTLERIKLGHTPDIEPSVSIKLEEPDIYPWHSTTTTDIGSNLLRHSDDPLISGAIDDNQNEFNPIKTSLPIQSNGSPTISTPQNIIRSTARSPSTNRNTNNAAATAQPAILSNPSATPTNNNKKPSRTRRKGQFKLRFHHQALPQEYLDHYEAAQNNLQKKEAEQIKLANQKAAAASMTTPSSSSAASLLSAAATSASAAAAAAIEVNEQAARKHDSVRNWLQKISEYQHESSSASTPQPPSALTSDTIKLDPLLTMNDCSTSSSIPAATISTSSGLLKKQPAMSSSRMVSYNDLPYMGEMTLDNCKPRRGRKPKKADICHLIYKNYGTILPGTPKEMRENNERSQSEAHHHHQHHQHHNDLVNNSNNKNTITAADTITSHHHNKSTAQTKLLGSLLEKRLTNENNRKTPQQLSPSISPVPPPPTPTPSTPPTTITLKITEENIKLISGKSEEPLNLCVRDRSETLSVSSEDTESCFLDADASSIRTSPLISPSETDTLLAANFKMSLPNFQTAMMNDMSSCTTDNLLLPSSTNMDSATTTTTTTILTDHYNLHLHQQPSTSTTTPPPGTIPATVASSSSSSTPPPGYVYWPAGGVFIHPMTLYYQKMVDANNTPTTSIRLPRLSPVPQQSGSSTTIGNNITTNTPTTQSLIINTRGGSPSSISMPSPSSSSISSSSPVTNVISVNRHDGTAKILIPKNISQLLKQEKLPPSITSPSVTTSPQQHHIPSDAASSASSKSASTSSSLCSGVGGGGRVGSPASSTSTGTTIANTTAPPQKRKRSAIFIPPMPVESSSSHATEVSICKFKFTGGAKPSLQEKKMLSVDSGGNFRYYSGTGDKSMRGYEFFPRESLQQSSLLAGSSAGAFLNTPGEKIDLPPPSQGLSNEILQIPELPQIPTNVNTISSPSISRHNQHHNNYHHQQQQHHHKLHPPMHLLSTPPSPSPTQLSQSPTPPSPQAPSASSLPPSQLLSSIQISPSSSPVTRQHTTTESNSNRSNSSRNRTGCGAGAGNLDRRKRKSRRSLQRENLEKTFKEKGFLIQTQQLESAEGATYCKFRQLRKFTRYLFRSWKDYLPGELQQGQSVDGGAVPAHLVDGIDPSTILNSQMLMAAATATGGGAGGGTVQNETPSPTLLQQQQQQLQLHHQYPSNIGKGNTINSILHSPNIIKSSPSPT